MDNEARHESAVWAARVVALSAIAVAYVVGNADGFGVGQHGLAWLGLAGALLTGLAHYLPRPLGEPKDDDSN